MIAVEDPRRKDVFAEVAGGQDHIRQAPLFLVWLADLNRSQQVATTHGLPADGVDYFDTFLVGVVDAALAAQNVVVAAESLGLGTVYIGALRNDVARVARELNLPEQVFPVFGLVIGLPDPAKPAAIKPRLPQNVVLHKEQYQREPLAQSISDYDAVMKIFQRGQKQPEIGWSWHSSERLSGADKLNGRQYLRTALAKLGFKLA